MHLKDEIVGILQDRHTGPKQNWDAISHFWEVWFHKDLTHSKNKIQLKKAWKGGGGIWTFYKISWFAD